MTLRKKEDMKDAPQIVNVFHFFFSFNFFQILDRKSDNNSYHFAHFGFELGKKIDSVILIIFLIVL